MTLLLGDRVKAAKSGIPAMDYSLLPPMLLSERDALQPAVPSVRNR